MKSFQKLLTQDLDAIDSRMLRRRMISVESAQSTKIRVSGGDYVNFSSNDYLGLANDIRIRSAVSKAIDKWGVGSGASRLICGNIEPHVRLETELAEWKQAEAALSFSSGYAASVGAVTALLGRGDVIIIDRLAHASTVDAARFCRAELRVYRHNDLKDLEKKLQWAVVRRTQGVSRILVVTESVFSMDGDLSPLREIVELKDRYDAWLMVDEAHSTGVFGPNGGGLAEALGVGSRIEVRMGTLSKGVGAAGGFICGDRLLIDLLIHKARSFVFSTAPSPTVAAAATAAIELIRSEEGAQRRTRLWENVEKLSTGLKTRFGDRFASCVRSPIFPIVIGGEEQALKVADRVRDKGFIVGAVRYPTVRIGEARLRVTVTAMHSDEEITGLLDALERVVDSGPASD